MSQTYIITIKSNVIKLEMVTFEKINAVTPSSFIHSLSRNVLIVSQEGSEGIPGVVRMPEVVRMPGVVRMSFVVRN